MKALAIIFCLLFSAAGVAANKDFFEGKSKLKDPFSIRDPFRSEAEKRLMVPKAGAQGAAGNSSSSSAVLRDGTYTNLAQIPSDIDIAKLNVVGVLIGKERRAIVRISGGGTVVLREGMKIGANRLELKAIMPGGLVFVEKILNIYGQEEYLETVVPVSK